MVQKEPKEFFALAALVILSGTYKKSMFLETLDRCSHRYWRWGGRGLCLGAEKLEARKMFEKTAESPASSARFVRQPARLPERWQKKDTAANTTRFLHTSVINI